MDTNQAPVPSTPETTTSGGEFTVGRILNRTLNVLKQKPILFIGLTLVALVPATIIMLLLIFALAAKSATGAIVGVVIGSILSYILTLVLQGAISYGVFRVLRNEDANFGNSLGRGLASAGSLIVLSIIVGICIGIGYMLLVIPGVIISCILAVVVPVCVVERKGAFECMGRSAELTKGYRVKIFGLYFIVGIIIFIVNKIVTTVVMGIIPGVLVSTIIAMIIISIPQAYNNIMTAIIYYDLRDVKEGVSVDSLAKVFD